MKPEACHAADNVLRKVKKYVSGEDVRRMRDQGSPCREGAPLMISGASAAALSWMLIRIMCLIIQVTLPEVHNKTTKTNGLTLQQPFLNK